MPLRSAPPFVRAPPHRPAPLAAPDPLLACERARPSRRCGRPSAAFGRLDPPAGDRPLQRAAAVRPPRAPAVWQA
eukprot:2428809-Prymnesium_polylepis.1